MPMIALKSKVRTASEHCNLSLNIRHRLLLDQPSESDLVFDMKPTIPEAVDVLLFSNLIITVSGTLDGTRIAPAELKASHLANHLVDFLQTNSGELGINAVSDLYISEETHLLSLTLTVSRHFPTSTNTLLVHLKLIALDLDYVWQTNSNTTTSSRLDAAINPFARHLSLPYLTATDNAVGRFVTFHLVRRYPLIFGPWCKQLDVECSFFPSILISIQSIMERSYSSVFQATCQNLFKLCKREIMSTSISTAGALSKYLGLEVGTYSAPAFHTCDEEEAFLLCLERFYRLGMKRTNFRHLSLFPTATTGSSEDLLSDAFVTFDAFGVNHSLKQSSEAGLVPHVSLFDGTHMAGLSDLELNTEDEHDVTPNSYQNNNTPQESLDPFDAKGTEISNQDLCDDIYELSEHDVGSYGTCFEKHPLNDRSKAESPDLAVASGIDCLLEEPDVAWQLSTHHDWSHNSLSSQEYEQDSLGKVSSPRAYSMAQPLKMPTSLYLPTALEDILDSLHSGYAFAQTEDFIQECPVSQKNSSGDYFFELESDMHTDLTPDLVSKSVITDGDHGIMAFDFIPESSQASISRGGTPALFSDQLSGQPMCGYGGEGPAVGGGNSGVINDPFLVIEYDSDVAE